MSRLNRIMGIKWDKVVYINERAEENDKDTFRFLFIHESLSTVAVLIMIDKQEKIRIHKFIIHNYVLLVDGMLIFIKMISLICMQLMNRILFWTETLFVFGVIIYFRFAVDKTSVVYFMPILR
jgi:hypothetical protein